MYLSVSFAHFTEHGENISGKCLNQDEKEQIEAKEEHLQGFIQELLVVFKFKFILNK